MTKPVNQIILGAPKLGVNQKWNVVGYLKGKSVNKSNKPFEQFSELQFIERSGDYFHFLGNGRFVLVCSIVFKS